jgi:hypothetical protein
MRKLEKRHRHGAESIEHGVWLKLTIGHEKSTLIIKLLAASGPGIENYNKKYAQHKIIKTPPPKSIKQISDP